ncbi:hypothetical protein SAMN05660337_1211 [Maridesulfovibrio ferrireducens]|uniref:Conjugal transfer protein TraD n=1 Tax=Maridesulfovibrio ferrireducens TaxID=246191 RepID=A0A1G9EPR2_9BACT|nr:hypothetical protein [Maridesulfovibrio ferrireducens]SDK78119.1 hypothetical protein SAMN05660337_1211 [Maridesulfovibrio ferrireducens]
MSDKDEIKKRLDEQAHQIDRDLTENSGAALEIDPELAEHMGAFEEDAISLEEAEDASFDPFDAEEDPEPED